MKWNQNSRNSYGCLINNNNSLGLLGSVGVGGWLDFPLKIGLHPMGLSTNKFHPQSRGPLVGNRGTRQVWNATIQQSFFFKIIIFILPDLMYLKAFRFHNRDIILATWGLFFKEFYHNYPFQNLSEVLIRYVVVSEDWWKQSNMHFISLFFTLKIFSFLF